MREFAARFRPFFVSAALFSLVMNLVMLVPAIFMLQVYDRVITSRSVETLGMLLVVTVVALLLMAYLDMIRTRLLSGAAVALEKVVAPRVLADMVRRGMAPGLRDSLYGLRDVGAVRTFLTGPGIVALFDAPWVPIYIAVITLLHPLLGATGLFGAIVLLAIAWLNEKMARKPLEATQLAGRKAGRFADQSIANAEVAGALGMIDNLRAGWERLSRRSLEHQLEASRATSALASLSRFIRQFLQTIMLAAGAWLVIEQQATSGVMIAAVILLGRALAPIEQAIAGWKSLVNARAAYGRLDTAFAAEPSAVPTELPAPKGELTVERIVFGFRGQDRPTIKGVSFQLAPGETLAIVGPSAAGKSTLARLMVGIWPPSSGVVRLDGAEIGTWPRERLGPHVGYLPQNVELFAGTVSENIARMGEIDSEAVIRAARRANAHDMILRLPHGYDTPIGEGGSFLSAGQRQRVALARALYGNPRFVVLDEPNSNLDSDGESALIEALRELQSEGVTVVVITHRTTLLAVADMVMVLRDGAVERLGAASQILGPMRPQQAKGPLATILTGSVTAKG